MPGQLADPLPQAEQQTDVHDQPRRSDQPKQSGPVTRSLADQGDGAAGRLEPAHRLAGTDLVVTGEGSLDEQSLGGKTPMGVATTAHAAGVPVVAVCGRTTLDEETRRAAGFVRTYALTELEPDPRVSMREAGRLLEQVGARLALELPALLTGTRPN